MKATGKGKKVGVVGRLVQEFSDVGQRQLVANETLVVGHSHGPLLIEQELGPDAVFIAILSKRRRKKLLGGGTS